jgi:anaerobic ribonucleoside-triphosphate reductase activating protein
MPEDAVLSVHAAQSASRSNGPGLRGVLWLQGCSLGCPGCFNSETHSRSGGAYWSLDSAFDWVSALPSNIQGLTISGGEPLQQIAPLSALLTRVRTSTSLSVVVFTGFEWAEVQRLPGYAALLASIDVLIAGRYRQDLRVARSLTGSANKNIHFLTARYSPADFSAIPEAEIILSPGGDIALSGIDPLEWG